MEQIKGMRGTLLYIATVRADQYAAPEEKQSDLLALEKYIVQKGYQDRCADMKLYDNMRNLKWVQLKETLEVMEDMNPDSLDESYEAIATIWS